MAISVTNDLIRDLALANGLHFPEERLDRIRKQYEIFLQALERIDTFNLAREAEPETVFSLELD
jgi:hypothetical protein